VVRRQVRLAGFVQVLLRGAGAAILRLGEAAAFFGLFRGALEFAQALFARGPLSECPRLVQLVALSGEASLGAKVFEVIGRWRDGSHSRPGIVEGFGPKAQLP